MPTPPLLRQRLTAPSMVDIMTGVAAAILVVTATVLTDGADAAAPHLRALGVGGYLLVGLGGLALAFRNSAPTATLLVTLALGLIYQGARYPGGPDPAPVVLALYTLAERGERQRALGFSLVASILLVGVRAAAVPGGASSPLIIIFPTTAVAALYAGQIVAGRRARQEKAARLAAEATRNREEDTRRRIDAERLRIARELHDVVAHNISLINVQATMGVHLMEQRPAEAAAALAAIKVASKQALRELRRILDVLRQADEAEPTAPAPGLADLDALVSTTTQAGLPIEVTVHGTARELPATVDVAAYRIIQESLTNALRYAAPAPARVTLRYLDASLELEVKDDGISHPAAHSAGTGHGIAGMRERTAAVGGWLSAEPVTSGGFAVSATLPLTETLP